MKGFKVDHSTKVSDTIHLSKRRIVARAEASSPLSKLPSITLRFNPGHTERRPITWASGWNKYVLTLGPITGTLTHISPPGLWRDSGGGSAPDHYVCRRSTQTIGLCWEVSIHTAAFRPLLLLGKWPTLPHRMLTEINPSFNIAANFFLFFHMFFGIEVISQQSVWIIKKL